MADSRRLGGSKNGVSGGEERQEVRRVRPSRFGNIYLGQTQEYSAKTGELSFGEK